MSIEKEFDQSLNIQDKIRLRLGEAGTRYVPITVPDLAAELRVTPYVAYQAIARLKNKGELEVEKDGNKVVGVTINKLEPSGRTYQRAAERAKESIAKEVTSTENIQSQMTALKEYLDKKMAILDMQDRAREAGLDPEATVKFEESPVAEEGILLLKLLGDAFEEIGILRYKLQMTTFDLEAEKRNVAFLSGEKRAETRRELASTTS